MTPADLVTSNQPHQNKEELQLLLQEDLCLYFPSLACAGNKSPTTSDACCDELFNDRRFAAEFESKRVWAESAPFGEGCCCLKQDIIFDREDEEGSIESGDTLSDQQQTMSDLGSDIGSSGESLTGTGSLGTFDHNDLGSIGTLDDAWFELPLLEHTFGESENGSVNSSPMDTSSNSTDSKPMDSTQDSDQMDTSNDMIDEVETPQQPIQQSMQPIQQMHGSHSNFQHSFISPETPAPLNQIHSSFRPSTPAPLNQMQDSHSSFKRPSTPAPLQVNTSFKEKKQQNENDCCSPDAYQIYKLVSQFNQVSRPISQRPPEPVSKVPQIPCSCSFPNFKPKEEFDPISKPVLQFNQSAQQPAKPAPQKCCPSTNSNNKEQKACCSEPARPHTAAVEDVEDISAMRIWHQVKTSNGHPPISVSFKTRNTRKTKKFPSNIYSTIQYQIIAEMSQAIPASELERYCAKISLLRKKDDGSFERIENEKGKPIFNDKKTTRAVQFQEKKGLISAHLKVQTKNLTWFRVKKYHSLQLEIFRDSEAISIFRSPEIRIYARKPSRVVPRKRKLPKNKNLGSGSSHSNFTFKFDQLLQLRQEIGNPVELQRANHLIRTTLLPRLQ